jgi:hypothetical protein
LYVLKLKEQTIRFLVLMMFSIPNGVWAQAVTIHFMVFQQGMGLNLTSRIALEYNYEEKH